MKTVIETTQILREIFKNPRISQREIAFKNRISLGKVNYAIQSLIKKGFIKIHNFSGSKNKRNYMYILTPEGMYEKVKLTAVFLKWKMEEYERIKREIEELDEDMKGSATQGMKVQIPEGDSSSSDSEKVLTSFIE